MLGTVARLGIPAWAGGVCDLGLATEPPRGLLPGACRVLHGKGQRTEGGWCGSQGRGSRAAGTVVTAPPQLSSPRPPSEMRRVVWGGGWCRARPLSQQAKSPFYLRTGLIPVPCTHAEVSACKVLGPVALFPGGHDSRGTGRCPLLSALSPHGGGPIRLADYNSKGQKNSLVPRVNLFFLAPKLSVPTEKPLTDEAGCGGVGVQGATAKLWR